MATLSGRGTGGAPFHCTDPVGQHQGGHVDQGRKPFGHRLPDRRQGQAAQRMADQDRRLPGRYPVQHLDRAPRIAVEIRIRRRRRVVAASGQVEGQGGMANPLQQGNQLLPAPAAVPGAMDQKEARQAGQPPIVMPGIAGMPNTSP